jgi:outer membrane protein OmpA-like peptidoglycan-associated protein
MAQTGKDTVFTFYFNTNAHTTSSTQQKDFERFLAKVQRITTINGYTDTTGQWQHNEWLSQQRALAAYTLLPKTMQQGVTINANGETKTAGQLGQNRRAEVVALIAAKTEANVVIDTANFSTTDSAGKVTELNIAQLLFVPDQPELTAASRQYVQTLARQLLQYKDAQFQIIGHVNYQSKLPPERLPDLYELSEKRAKAVYDLLVQNGIAADRMTYKGVGNAQPVIANPKNDDEKRKNMRVQVLVIRQ